MPDEKLQYVIDIIRESADFDTEREEIDIDKIDTVTQRKLQNFVLKNKPKQRGKTQKNKPAPASPEKAEPPEIEPTIEISPKPLPVNKEKDGCFSDTESDSEASDDKPGFVGGGWGPRINQESGKEDEDPSWGIALVESKKIQARKKEKDVRDAEELVEQKKVKEKKEADIAAKVKEKKEESLRRKEEEDRVREEKEKNERDRQKKLRQQIFDSTNITQTVKIDDKGDMEDYENYACNDGGDSPASSNFGF